MISVIQLFLSKPQGTSQKREQKAFESQNQKVTMIQCISEMIPGPLQYSFPNKTQTRTIQMDLLT